MWRRGLAIGVSLLAMALFAMGLTAVQPAINRRPLTAQVAPSVWVLSDTHFIAPSLHDGGRAWRDIQATAAGKELRYQPVAIRALVHAATTAKPKPAAVIITGDLTFNGELASATSLAKRLAPLAKAGIRLLVIPGNHDIYDGWARAYRGSKQLRATQIGPADWRRVFAGSYAAAFAEDPASLSYAVRLNPHYQLLMLDTNSYTMQPASQAPATGGQVSRATIQWLTKQLQAGKAAGVHSVVFMHHDLYAHDRRMQAGWVVDQAPTLRRLFTRYHVPVVFAGHIHAQDIAADPAGQATPIEVLSGSFTTSPGYYGSVRLAPHAITYQAHPLNVKPVLTAAQLATPALANYPQFMKQTFKQANAGLLMQDVLLAKGMTDQKLTALSDLMTEMMWQFFAGRDDAAGAKRLQQMPGYRYLQEFPSLARQFHARELDRNLPDLHLRLAD